MILIKVTIAVWMIFILASGRAVWLYIINLAGFGNGIGSGRSSGYGRYHVEDIK